MDIVFLGDDGFVTRAASAYKVICSIPLVPFKDVRRVGAH